ncbi:serine hydrolase domain-containing protein [Aurantivibrio plasticivorans]
MLTTDLLRSLKSPSLNASTGSSSMQRRARHAGIFRQVLITTVVLCGCSFALAEPLPTSAPEQVNLSTERLSAIGDSLEGIIDEGQLQGSVTLVARHGKLAYQHVYGTLDIETDTPLQPDSLFRIYSMTKPIVTVAAMQLYEQGKFQLTDPVSRYLPAFKNTRVLRDGKLVEPSTPITIQHLMTHTSGMVYDFLGRSEVVAMYQKENLRNAKDNAEFVERIAKLPLQQEPGSQWVYSFSVDVLGRLVEVIAGDSLGNVLHDTIFEPLGMENTFFEVPGEKLYRFGTNHQFAADGTLNIIDRPSDSAFVNKTTFESGGGGLVSTAQDYLTFCQMMLNGGSINGVQILSPKTVSYMTRDHLPGILGNTSGVPNRPGFGFGLGFAVTTDPVAAGTISSAGEYYWSGVAGTLFWIDPAEDLIVISMIQQRSSRVPLRNLLKQITYGAMLDAQ